MKFSPLQLSFVMILFIGISDQIIFLPYLQNIAKRDSWICILIAYVVLIFWGIIIYLILKKMGSQKPFYWIKGRAGAAVAGIILSLLFLYILFIGMASFYQVVQSIKIFFLPITPTSIVAISFLLLCLGATKGGFKTIVYLSGIILPLVLILAMVVSIATMKNKEYSFLFPVFIHGYKPIIKGTAIVLGGKVDLLVLLLLQHQLKKSYSIVHLLILITILIGLVIVPVMDYTASFGPNVAGNLRFPAFEQWRLITLGSYITRLDFLAVFIILSGTTIKVSLCLSLLNDLMKRSFIQIAKYMKFVFSLVFFSTIYIHSDLWVQFIVEKYIYPYLFIYGLIISILLLIISYLPAKKGIQPL